MRTIENVIMVVTCLIVAYVIIWLIHDRRFPDGATLRADAAGIIHHPTYGDYPQNVPFEQGMTIYPGQRAELQMLPEKGTEL